MSTPPPKPIESDIVAAFGRHFLVRHPEGLVPWKAVARGRRSDCVVGDRVRILPLNVAQAVIVSGHPMFDEALLLRILIALESEQIPVLIVATKDDLVDSRQAIAARRAVYESLGYPVVTTSAKSGPAPLAELSGRLAGRRTVLLGQSGMGKSTLINALVPGASQQTAAISEALASGRHTTTFTRAFDLPAGGTLIDSPGFQSFEIAHLSRWQAIHGMPEFRPLLGRCRFNDCNHRTEPDCAIRAAAEAGRIDGLRYRLFTALDNG